VRWLVALPFLVESGRSSLILHPGSFAQGIIGGNPYAEVRLHVPEGQAATVELEQWDRDLKLELHAPHGMPRVVDLTETGPERIQISSGVVRLRIVASNPKLAPSNWKLAWTSVTRSNPHRTRAEDAQTRGRVNRDALSLEQALQHWRLAEDRAGIASAQLYLGEQLAVKERWTEAGQRLVEALGGSNDAWLRAESLGNLAHVQWSQGAFQDAEKNFQDAEKLAKQIGNRRVEAAAHNGLGILYREMGDYQRAREHYARSRDLIIQLGDQRTEGIIRGNLGVMLDALGEPEEALSELREATRIADAHGIRLLPQVPASGPLRCGSKQET